MSDSNVTGLRIFKLVLGEGTCGFSQSRSLLSLAPLASLQEMQSHEAYSEWWEDITVTDYSVVQWGAVHWAGAWRCAKRGMVM